LSTAVEAAGPSRSLVTLFAIGAGLSAACLYYNQPILSSIAAELGVSAREIGIVPTLTQLGYATGLVLFAPLGDRLERRQVIVGKLIVLAGALALAGLAGSIVTLGIASLVIGLLATAAQDFVPAAATCAPPETRGKTVGTVMTGLLLGILLSRMVSGAVSERFGWRVVFVGSSTTVAALAIVSGLRLPRLLPEATESYGALLRSMVTLLRTVAPLKRAAFTQALLSLAFSAFWSTLALALAAPPFHLGSTAAGLFGLAGAAGALVAPIAGAIADKRGPVAVIRLGAMVVVLAFLAMGVWSRSLGVLIAGTVIFDLGVQACLISHQAIIYSLASATRSRLNALLVSSMFVGMSLGAAIASQVLGRFGWSGVMFLGAAAAALALVVRLLPER
jgi:predicted MFS family arabinose efflux permease